jgi:hypothetical protein
LTGAVFAAPANAVPINFNITNSSSFTPGSGYGVDASENPSVATLLGVVFSATGLPQNFNLNSVGSSFIFQYGTVNFNEPDGNGSNGISNNETDNLGVTADFAFTNPLIGTQNVIGAGTAFHGSINKVNGPHVLAYEVSWTPLTVNFGTTGQFKIELGGLEEDQSTINPLMQFEYTPEVEDLWAKITLLADDAPNGPPPGVPEPASIFLLGSGLALVAAGRRRRSKI